MGTLSFSYVIALTVVISRGQADVFPADAGDQDFWIRSLNATDMADFADLGLAAHRRTIQSDFITGMCMKDSDVLYNLPERVGAMSTGSISGFGVRLSQNYLQDCPNYYSKRFRTIDGTCNNPFNLGASATPVPRIVPPQYGDGVGAPRTKAADGSPLPGARFVSSAVHPAVNNLTNRPIIAMQWGQWIDHDMAGIAASLGPNGTALQCCGPNKTAPPAVTSPNCFPILLPPDEKDFVGTCMNFVRSLAATNEQGCEMKQRQQVNTITSFIDASPVYGSTENVARILRNPGDFLLKTKNTNFLPENVNGTCIRRPGTKDYCFLAGDFRVNQLPFLQSLHTIWLRAHNTIARRLRVLRPKDSNEETFERTRKLIGALTQAVTYNEWLPFVLGKEATKFNLVSRTGRTKTSLKVDPRIRQEFSTAAMRFGHSTVPDVFPIGQRRVPISQLFNRPGEVLDNFDDVVAGMVGVGTPGQNLIQQVDRNFVAGLTKHLFEPPNSPKNGLDLISFNIQRGRDHGIGPYTTYRKLCGLRPLTGFNDVSALGPNVAQLAKVYKSVNDIDLFTGLVHEPVDPSNQGLVGPTLTCILCQQFLNLKFGDRFFFDTDEKLIAFNDNQLKWIRQATLSKIICATTNIKALPNDIFNFPSKSNPLVSCDRLANDMLNLSAFA
ncbi:unnamed protein product [Lymnaea stagnalis]|uniref:Peroxidase n=1 Tax=Lymnaea stagnalis TaxID=6523 RepID=A0AAV2IQV9_LYMST